MPILHWLTRDRDVKAADAVPYRLLERDAALSAGAPGSGNMLIQGDNLEALKSLLPYYRGQVKCIYIDPPYNTRSAVSVHYDDMCGRPLRCKSFRAAMSTGRVHPCVRPVRAAPHGCWP